MTVRVLDAQGGLNLNTVEEQEAPGTELKGLRIALSSAVDQILDWRRGQRAAALRNGARLPTDGDRGSRWTDPQQGTANFPAIEEAVFASIVADLCLGGDGKVHLASASSEVHKPLAG